jgi:hypothetical protein
LTIIAAAVPLEKRPGVFNIIFFDGYFN